MKEIPKLNPFCPCPICHGTTDIIDNVQRCESCKQEWDIQGNAILTLQRKLIIVRSRNKPGKPLSLWPLTFHEALTLVTTPKRNRLMLKDVKSHNVKESS